ncbi:YdcH family protein [Primorskyibacter sp. 2E233]|uniref:YdcH family protein n=1 Tax=Primorskyibacter sp. 2E233 TaxID=3413431 RepID=UPI003BF212EE
MSLSSHLQELKKKHQSLSEAVKEAQAAPGVDDLRVAELKKQKLRLKEEISKIEMQPAL